MKRRHSADVESYEGEKSGMSDAAKIALAVTGIGLVAGVTLIIGIDRIMKNIFVHENWPDEEWSSDDWAGEDLDN